MTQNFILMLSSWGALALIVLALAAYRSQLGRKEDDVIHISEGEPGALIAEQTHVNHKIDVVERWGKILTIVLVLYGVGLGAYYLYQMWQAQSSTVFMQ